MPRHRRLKFIAYVLGIALVMYIMIGLFLPSPRRLIVGVDKRDGRVRLVESGITFLPWHRFYRLSFEKREGVAQSDGLVRINTQEGVPVTLTYRLRFGIDGRTIPDARRLVAEGWSAWIRARVGEAVSAVIAGVPVEELSSPGPSLSARRQRLQQVVAQHLAQSGLRDTTFAIQRVEIDKEALLRFKRAELRRRSRGVLSPVVVLGLEGADWELLTELMIDGVMPNLEALVDGGATASIQTLQPTVAPLLWSTVATGLSPDRHGIVDFVDHERGGSPIDARSRHGASIWEIASAFGRTSSVVNWWASWPPLTPGVATFDVPAQTRFDALDPRQLETKVQSLTIPEATIGYPQMSRFLNVTQNEFQKSISVAAPYDPIVTLRTTLSKTWTDHRVALELYKTLQPTLMLVHYEGTDTVNHRFGPYHPPYRDGVDDEGFRKYWPTVARYYGEIDRLIGEWIKTVPKDSTLMILSAHGMIWGRNRPLDPPAGESTLTSHRNPGVLIAYGERVIASRARRKVSIYDIAPTLLSILGLPKSREMQGSLPQGLLRDVDLITTVGITSYSDLLVRAPVVVNATIDPQTYRARLAAIGHLADPNRPLMPMPEDEEATEIAPLPPDQWGLYAYYNNLGVQLHGQKKRREAAEAFSKAIELNPARVTPYINLAIVLLEGQEYAAAETILFRALPMNLRNAEDYLLDFAAWYRGHKMTTRAIQLLERGKTILPQSSRLAANLGSAYATADRYTEALGELERALALQPTSIDALNNLGLIFMKRNDYNRALDFWNRSLSIQPHQPKIREGVLALQSRL